MKSLLTLILLSTVILLVSCAEPQGVTNGPFHINVYEVSYKGHQYLAFPAGHGLGIEHNPDCHCLQKESNSREL